MTYDQVWWPILGICALHLSHPKCTHTQQWTHTPWTHTRSSGQPFMLWRPGSSLRVRCLAQGYLSRGIEGGESAVHSLPPPTIPAGPRLKLATFRSRVRLSNHSAMTSRKVFHYGAIFAPGIDFQCIFFTFVRAITTLIVLTCCL